MQFRNAVVIVALASLSFSWSVWAQEKPEREIEIHKNVKLVLMAAGPDLPAAVSGEFKKFLPILEEALKEVTADQSDECALTLRVTAGFKEVGSAKVQRPQARFTAFRRNSRQEYVGSFILYSYINSGPVNKDETSQFLTKQILEPAACAKAE
jgi:hypothetical protein